MSKFKFVLNPSGVRQLLRSADTMSVCQGYAQQIYSRCPSVDGYVLKEQRYPERNGYMVAAVDYPAIQDNIQNNTLLKVRGW